MALDTPKRTLVISLTVAVVIIVGAYYFSGHHFSLSTPVSAESTQEMLKAYATKDSDGDGLPDWEEALYGTDPTNAHSVRASLTDSQAVAQGLVTPQYATTPAAPHISSKQTEVPGNAAAPGSLTDQFAQLFFSTYMNQRGAVAPSADDLQNFVQSAVAQLETTQVRINAYSTSDMHIVGQGGSALKLYAAAIDDAFTKNTVQLPYDELTYFADATEKNDPTALANVAKIGSAYLAIARASAAAPVPQEAASAHLAVVNAMARLGNTISDLAAVNDDPIRAMLGLQSYPGDVAQFATSLTAMNAVFAADGVQLTDIDAGHSFFHLTTVATEQSTAATTP